MDARQTGALIYMLRRERSLTQQQLGDMINVSGKTISKWERGHGCPDITLLPGLSAVFGVDINRLLAGTLDIQSSDGGNMKQIQFYVCPECGSLVSSSGNATVTCCGRVLEPRAAKKPVDNDAHCSVVQVCDNERYVTFNHPMNKDHYLMFAAFMRYDRMELIRLYPEQEAAFSIPAAVPGKLLVFCSCDGLFEVTV